MATPNRQGLFLLTQVVILYLLEPPEDLGLIGNQDTDAGVTDLEAQPLVGGISAQGLDAEPDLTRGVNLRALPTRLKRVWSRRRSSAFRP